MTLIRKQYQFAFLWETETSYELIPFTIYSYTEVWLLPRQISYCCLQKCVT